MDEKIIAAHGLTVGVGKTKVLTDVSFESHVGDTTVILGSNGAGKTMLVKTLLGLIPKLGGTVEWKKGTKIGYVPQKFTIDKQVPISIAEFLKLKSQASDEKIVATMNMVGLLAELLHRPMRDLSGGQFQRVIVAWSVVDDPDVLIFDEPTESIDIAGQECIYALIKELKQSRRISVFMVTHDLDVVYMYADHVLSLQGGTMVVSENPKELLDKKMLEQIYGNGIHNHGH